MPQEYPGYLTDRFRDYLRGDRNINNADNPSREKAEFRDRVTGAKRDSALIQSSDEDWVPVELLKAERNVHDPRGLQAPLTTEAIERNYDAVKTQSDSVGLDVEGVESALENIQEEIERVDSYTGDQMKKDVRELYEQLFAIAFIETVDGMLNGAAGNVDKVEVVEGLIENAWPSKEQVLQSAHEELSND